MILICRIWEADFPERFSCEHILLMCANAQYLLWEHFLKGMQLLCISENVAIHILLQLKEQNTPISPPEVIHLSSSTGFFMHIQEQHLTLQFNSHITFPLEKLPL